MESRVLISYFEVPSGWQLLAMNQTLEPIAVDMMNPEKSKYEEYPRRVIMSFGKRAEENEITQDMIDKQNEKDIIHGQETLVMYSSEEIYAYLYIGKATRSFNCW